MRKISTFIFGLILQTTLFAQVPNVSFNTVASGFSAVTVITNCGDDRLFIAQQAGLIRQYNIVTNQISTFIDLTSFTLNSGERGLLGLAFHPNYQQNGYFYVNYTTPSGTTVVSRFSVNPNNPNQGLNNTELILFTQPQPYANHNGGDLAFGPDGYLYISLGDGGSGGDPQNYSQNKNTLLGKLLRIDVNSTNGSTNYAIPPTNPFIGQANTKEEIWAYGLRNAWKFSFDKLTGDIWIGDVGQNAWEEVNFQPASSTGGENYGWRCYEGNVTYNMSQCAGITGLTFPVYVYNHSFGCSVTGGNVYRGALSNQVYGRYFMADYCSGRIWSLFENGIGGYTADEHGAANNAFYSAFGEDRYGEIYIARRSDGTIRKMSVADCIPVASLSAASSLTICEGDSVKLNAVFNPALTYTFFKDNEQVAQNQLGYLFASESGMYKVTVSNGPGCENTSDSLMVNVVDPVVGLAFTSVGDTIMCFNDIMLDINLAATPEGGVFSGPGVFDNLFNPSVAGVGTHQVLYSYLSPQGCTATIAQTYEIFATPSPTIDAPTTIILNNPIGDEYQLSASPTGGAFSGGNFINENGLINTSALNTLPSGSTVFVTYQVEVNGCVGSSTISIQIDNQIGFDDLDNFRAISFFPNPASNDLTIQFSGIMEPIKTKIYSLSGQLIKSEIISIGQSTLSVDGLRDGYYLIDFEVTGLGKQTRKLIIQKN